LEGEKPKETEGNATMYPEINTKEDQKEKESD